MLTIRERIYRITDGLERFIPHYELAVMNQASSLKGVDKALAELEAAQAALTSLLTPTPAKTLSTAERITSLVAALAALARAKRALILKLDAFHSLAVPHFAPDVAPYWVNRAGEMSGWIQNCQNTVVPDELKRQGVLVWYVEPDRHFRLIDTNYLEAHADIRAHVAKEWEGGRRCRFCEMTELGTSQTLVAVEPEKRGPLGTINGVVVLQPGRVYVHERCAPYWERWRAIAESYKTPEEAAEADRVAGRQSRVPPDVTPEPVAAIADTTNHFNAAEQGKYR